MKRIKERSFNKSHDKGKGHFSKSQASQIIGSVSEALTPAPLKNILQALFVLTLSSNVGKAKPKKMMQFYFVKLVSLSRSFDLRLQFTAFNSNQTHRMPKQISNSMGSNLAQTFNNGSAQLHSIVAPFPKNN